MSYGTLSVYAGPMFSGKSTSTLKRILWARNGEGRTVHVFKPAFDNRYSDTEIVNHDGLRTPAISITEIPDTKFDKTDLVFIDEVQFMMDPYFNGDIVAWVKTLLSEGIEVIVAGLDMDWQGNPFDITSKLLAMANDAHKLTADCTVCGRSASKTFKKVQDPNSGSVELGATDLYEARCNQHWHYTA